MSLTKDLNNSKELKELFALDKVLRNLGLWFGPMIRGRSDEDRKDALEQINLDEPFVVNGSAYDKAGQQIVSITSETSYDETSGTLDDKIIFWKHTPYDQSNAQEASENYVIAMRYKQDPYQDQQDIPVTVPEQIWVNGQRIFNSTLNGGSDSPTEPKFRRLIDRIQEFSQRTKETLMEREPVENLAMIFAGGSVGDNILKEIAGSTPYLEGLSENGGFKRTLTPFFLDIIQEEDETLRLNCRSVETLKALHGFTENTVEKIRSLRDAWEKSATHMASGIRFVTLPQYKFDEDTGRHIFSLHCYPENPPADMDAPEEIEIARMEYEYNDEELFELKDWNFFESDKAGFTNLSKQHKLLGLFQGSLNYLNKNKYPPIHDLIYEVGLDDALDEFHTPPTLEQGHECLWIPFNGRNLDKQVGPGGDNLGGGNAFLTRYKKEDGTWRERGILIDMPYQPFGAKGDWEGIQPDFKQVLDKTDTIFLTHDHFDHATLEYAAYQGILKGKRVICDEAVEHIVRARMSTLGVKKEDFPMFVNYDDPNSGLVKLNDTTYAHTVKDDDGNTRGYMQICRKGALHTADVDAMMFTPCFNNDQWGETYYTYGDAYALSEHGKKFAAEGQLSLLRHPHISDEAKQKLVEQTVPVSTEKTKAVKDTKLLADLSSQHKDRDFSKLYIAMHDPTNCTQTGHAPRPDEVKKTWSELLKVCKDDLVFHVPFSTNSAEIRAFDDVIAQSETLRNSTDVGGNMEIRGSVLNKFGTHPDLDLRTVSITAKKHPQLLFDLALQGIEEFMTLREERAQKIADKRKDNKTQKDILSEDGPYQALKLMRTTAKRAISRGNTKPEILHRAFMSDDTSVFKEFFAKAGFAGENIDLDSLKSIPTTLFQEAKDDIKAGIYQKLDIAKHEKENPNESFDSVVNYWSNSNVDYWALKSILTNGQLQFDQLKPCTRNDLRMYTALMNEQETASLHHSRTSKIGKFFRNVADNLLIRTTGPFGTAEEQFATLYRYAYGDSLLDYDEFVRNTGYQIDDDTSKSIFVTQTPSTGRAAQIAQDKLMRTIVKNKNDTVFCATKNGFSVYNPKDKLNDMLASFKQQGWAAEWDARNNQIRVHDVPFHIHGHGFREDLRDIIKASRAKMHTIIHNPGWENYIAARELVQQEGGNFDYSDMKDFVGIKASYDDESGELKHDITDFLTPSYWLVRIRRKYGQMYGGVVEMMRAIVLRDDGNKKLSGTLVRRSGLGNISTFEQHTAHQAKTDFAQASGMEHSSRASTVGVAHANIRSPEKPRAPGMAEMVAMQLRKKALEETNNEYGGLDHDV